MNRETSNIWTDEAKAGLATGIAMGIVALVLAVTMSGCSCTKALAFNPFTGNAVLTVAPAPDTTTIIRQSAK